MTAILTNFYDPEYQLVKAIAPLFDKNMMFSKETAHGLKTELFTDQPDSEKVACVVELLGYSVTEQKAQQRSRSAKIRLEWRVTIVTPSELYNNLAGVMIVSAISRILGISESCGGRFEMIPDVSEMHRPKFDTNLTSVHATFGYDAIIKPRNK